MRKVYYKDITVIYNIYNYIKYIQSFLDEVNMFDDKKFKQDILFYSEKKNISTFLCNNIRTY